MDEPARILIALDEPAELGLVLRELAAVGANVETRQVEDEPTFVRVLSEFDPQLVISGHRMRTFDARQVLRLIRQPLRVPPVIVVMGTGAEEGASRAAGAADYVVKEQLARLGTAVRSARRGCRPTPCEARTDCGSSCAPSSRARP
jgi:CheY-like chemotaxis protein